MSSERMKNRSQLVVEPTARKQGSGLTHPPKSQGFAGTGVVRHQNDWRSRLPVITDAEVQAARAAERALTQTPEASLKVGHADEDYRELLSEIRLP